jgi:hypothetical protein
VNAILAISAILFSGVDPTTDIEKPKPPAELTPLPLGTPDDSPSIRLRIGRGIRLYFHETVYPLAESFAFAEHGNGWLGLGHNWYVGRNFSASVNLEAGPLGVGLPCRFMWYPMSGVGVEAGFDVLRLRLLAAVMVKP